MRGDFEEQAELTALLARAVPDFAFDDVLEPWPLCPRHNDHPLYAENRHGEAVWVCKHAAGGAIARIGSLAEAR